MKLFIISGLSGSGKSTVLHVLEDMGFFCIDNLPIGLLSSFAAQMISTPEQFYDYAAIGIDARNRSEDLTRFPSILKSLKAADIPCEVIFLDADDTILIKRFSETRRKHPLSNEELSLAEAISQERNLLDPIYQHSDLYLQTSHTNIYQLRDLVKERLADIETNRLSVLFLSFGFKHGLPIDADMVFDVRCLPNPYWQPRLREFTGKDQPVMDFLAGESMVDEMYKDLKNFIDSWIPKIEASDRAYLTIAVGCTGGQHRSVFLVEKLVKYFSEKHEVIARHRELQ